MLKLGRVTVRWGKSYRMSHVTFCEIVVSWLKSRVTRSCLHTSGADELTQEEGSTAYTHTYLIN